MAKRKAIMVYIDEPLEEWLNRKSSEGYKKSALIRYILEERMKLDGVSNEC